MKSYRTSSKSGLFLIELIIAITFFSVASAICIQLFTQAHLLGVRSADLNNAMTIAQNQAEQFKAMPARQRREYLEKPGIIEEYYGLAGDGSLVYLTQGDGQEARYCLRVKHSGQGEDLYRMDIQVVRAEDLDKSEVQPLYEIEVNNYEGL